MSDNINLVIFAFPSWEGNYMKSTVELTKEFISNDNVNIVLYIDYQYTWKDVFFNENTSWKNLLGFKKRIRSENGVIIYTPPPIIPMNWAHNKKIYSFLLSVNGAILLKSIKKAFKVLDIEDPIIINAFNPIFGLLFHNKLNAAAEIYYCYDNIAACDYAKNHGAYYENIYAKVVDMVVTSSKSLQQKFVPLNNNTKLVLNGANYQMYNQHFDANRFSYQKTAIIGYIGSIDNRLDYDILEYLIQSIPEAEFRFVGRITEPKAETLKKYNNVTFVGALPPEELAVEVNKMSLGLIPFVVNEFTKNVYPLKINEYFAAGLPVVSTRFADLSDFDGNISLASNKRDYCNAVKRDIIRNNQMQAQKRNAIAKNNSWNARASLFINYIKELIYE